MKKPIVTSKERQRVEAREQRRLEQMRELQEFTTAVARFQPIPMWPAQPYPPPVTLVTLPYISWGMAQ